MSIYKPSQECFDAASKAASGILGKSDIDAAFQEVQLLKEKLVAEGKLDNLPDRLRDAVAEKAERTRIAAAMQRRHAGLNALARDRLEQTLDAFKAAGLKPRQALLAVMEGSNEGVAGARNSVEATKLAFEGKFIGAMLSEIQRDRPHLLGILNDKHLSDDVAREMVELREGGRPGLTGNDDAKYLAKLSASYLELGRTEVNRLGGSIGKLDGYAGPQVWDDIKLIQATKNAWVEAVGPALDINRSFPDAASANEIRDILGDIYDTIITGTPAHATPAERGQRVNPANLAKSLGKSRVLHFKSADAALALQAQFGHGNTISGILAHQHKMAQVAAQMQVFGPNPEVMFRALVESQSRKVRDNAKLSEKRKAKLTGELNSAAGKLRQAFDIMSGTINRPVDVTAARIGSDIRAAQSMAKLGGAFFTAMPTDTVTAATAAMFRGGGFFSGLAKQLDGVFLNRPKGEVKEIGYLYGEGYDSIIGGVNHAAVAQDGPIGKLSKLQNLYFKANLLAPWTDTSRLVSARVVAAEMGMRAKTAYGSLPGAYRHLLSLHGITETHWDALRQAGAREVNGNHYITPDAIQRLPDAAVEPLVSGRLATAKTPERKVAILEDGRRELEMSVRRLVADEVNYGTLEVGARSRRTTTFGYRPGTLGGEVIRSIMQFKGFPIAFAQRVLGRAVFGHAGATKGERLLRGLPHLGALMAGLTVAGYMSLTMKDVAKGYWPPRDPTKSLKEFGKVLAASMVQGGAAGIYGDFLFAQQSRYGMGPLETLSGPAIGTAADIINIGIRARDGDPKAGDYINLVANNTPITNLFYVRPALDYMFLDSLREAASPGYMHRREQRRMKDYGQRSLLAQ